MRLLVLVVVVALVAACSAAPADRGAFTDTTPAAATDEPAPEKTPTSAPVTEEPAPEPDTCKRTAPSNACGVFPQCGCSTKETCDVTDTNGAAACIPAGKAAMGAPCTHSVGCAKGLSCVFGTCHAYCGAAGACNQPGTSDCIQVTAQGGTPIANLTVCLVACDLRDPMSCGGTTKAGTGVCIVDDQGKTDCVNRGAGGTRALNQSCTNDCGPGLVCTLQGTATVGTCKRWCRVGTNDCGGSALCSGFQTKVMVGPTEYGRCP